MNFKPSLAAIGLAAATVFNAAGPASMAWAGQNRHTGGIPGKAAPRVQPAFDVLHTTITTDGSAAVFHVAGFDGVTAALRVNASMHSPLLCVANVFKVASGDLSLPGKVNQ